MNFIFCMEINIKVFASRDYRFHDCNWTRTQNHLVRKRTTLNHLAKYGFTRKRVRDMRRKYSQLSFLMEVARYVQNTQNRKLVMLCNVLRK